MKEERVAGKDVKNKDKNYNTKLQVHDRHIPNSEYPKTILLNRSGVKAMAKTARHPDIVE